MQPLGLTTDEGNVVVTAEVVVVVDVLSELSGGTVTAGSMVVSGGAATLLGAWSTVEVDVGVVVVGTALVLVPVASSGDGVGLATIGGPDDN